MLYFKKGEKRENQFNLIEMNLFLKLQKGKLHNENAKKEILVGFEPATL